MEKRKIINIIVFIIILLVFVFIIFGKNDKSGIEKKEFLSIPINSGEKVYTYDKYIYIYGKSGFKIMEGEQTIIDEAFSVENPYIVSSYDKVAIGDRNGKVLRVYSSQGNMYTINSMYNILGFTVNKNGYSAVILKNDDNYQIDVYDKDGNNIYSINDLNYEEGIPTGVSISYDNKVLAVSLLKTQGATLDSYIVFYSIDHNILFGGFTKKDQFNSILRFLDKSHILCISDKELSILKVTLSGSNPEAREIKNKTLGNILKYVNFLDGVGFSILYDRPNGTTGDQQEVIEQNTLIFYDNLGGKLGSYSLTNSGSVSISTGKYGAIVGEGRLYTALNTSGRKIWEYQATQDIKDVTFYNSSSTALITTNSEIKIVSIDKKLLDIQINGDLNEDDLKDYLENNIDNEEITDGLEEVYDIAEQESENEDSLETEEENTKDTDETLETELIENEGA